jgi:phage terminase large subunit-like protein
MAENRFAANESPFIALADWDMCVDSALTPVVRDRSLPIVVGLDASVVHDNTAVVATTWDKAAQRPRLVAHREFIPSPNDPINFEAVENVVLDLSRRFRLLRVLYDPHQFASSSQRLVHAGIKMEAFQQTIPNLTAASQNLYELVTGHNLIVYPDRAMRLAISRSVAKETARGWLITKMRAAHKIDLAVALAMSCYGCVDQQSKPQHPVFTPEIVARIKGRHFRLGATADEPLLGPETVYQRQLRRNARG